jgi:signal-transduction protein with cAMP-binding, CBS, and nucleotidyltransferase domain
MSNFGLNMETEGLHKVVDRMVPLETEAWTAFKDQLAVRKLKKNEMLWNIGEVCREVGFITRGGMRYFFYRDGDEVTGQFFFENTFVTIYSSLITEKVTEIAFQAMEETEVLLISKTSLQKLYDEYKSWERFGRLMAEHNIVQMVTVRANLTSTTPREKYLQLLKERPKVSERVPLNIIASYLDITPEHLSRVRREITEKNL